MTAGPRALGPAAAVARSFWGQVAVLTAGVAAVVVVRLAAIGWRPWVEVNPFYVTLLPRFGWWHVMAAVFVAAGAAGCYVAHKNLPRRAAPFAAAVLAVCLALALGAAADGGPRHLRPPLVDAYLADARKVFAAGGWWSTYDDRLPTFAPHTRSHPPGIFLYLQLLTAAGLRDARAVGLVNLVVAAGAALPVYLVARRLWGGVEEATAACWFYFFSPAFLFFGTSLDGPKAVVFAAGAAALIDFFAEPTLLAAVATVAGATACLLTSYQFAFLLPFAAALAVFWGRANGLRRRHLLWGGVAAALVVAAFLALWAFTGYDARAAFRASYHSAQGVAAGGENLWDLLSAALGKGAPAKEGHRTYGEWVFGNAFAFSWAAGLPAIVLFGRGVWRARRRDDAGAVTTRAFLAAALLFNLTGFTLGEVERIWLYLVPWLAAGAAVGLTAEGIKKPAPWAVVGMGAAQAWLWTVLFRVP